MEESESKDYSVYPEGYRELRRQIDEEHEKIDRENQIQALTTVNMINNKGNKYYE